jgi:hypothetical protein
MTRKFAANDIVWCPNEEGLYVPAKIVADPESGKWWKRNHLYVKAFHGTSGRGQAGKWAKAAGIVFFDVVESDM